MLRLDAEVAPTLRECDYGRWIGRSLVDIAAEDAAGLDHWLNDIDSTPHGGESHAALLGRVADWMEGESRIGGRSVAITHVSIVRAAIVHVLQAPLTSFWRISVAPLTCATFTHQNGRWLLRALAGPRQHTVSDSGCGTSAD